MNWQRRAVVLCLLFAVTVIYLAIRYPGLSMAAMLGFATTHLVIFLVALLGITLILTPFTGMAVARVLPEQPIVTPSLDPEVPQELRALDAAWRIQGLTPATPVVLNAAPPIHIFCYLHPRRALMATLTRTASQQRVVTGVLSMERGGARFLETIAALDLDLYPIPHQVTRQVLPDANPAELLHEHIDAMDGLGWEFEPLTTDQVGILLARSYHLVRSLYVRHPVRTGVRLWARLVLRQTPNKGSLVQRLSL